MMEKEEMKTFTTIWLRNLGMSDSHLLSQESCDKLDGQERFFSLNSKRLKVVPKESLQS